MDAQLVARSPNPFSPPIGHGKTRSSSARVAAMAGASRDSASREGGGGRKDGWPARIAINYLSHQLQAATGTKNDKSGYEGLIEAAKLTSQRCEPLQQHRLVLGVLHKAVPPPILFWLRRLLPPSKFSRECSAAFTTMFFAWLVGPGVVKESELNGKREKNVVHIKKCRFLEESYCVGMCTNLCKVPTQMFIREALGMPLTMVPNFDDMSCEMVFGQIPPAAAEDPAMRQPCYELCKAKGKHNMSGSGGVHSVMKEGNSH